MSTNSSIEWTETTWNPVAGCTPVSPGCLNCYAAVMAHRLDAMGQAKYRGLTVLNNGRRTFNGDISLDAASLRLPYRWRKGRRVFVNSMSDLFHPDVPDQFVRKVFGVMSFAGQHTYQILTKRPGRMAAFFADTAENNLSACQAEWVASAECSGAMWRADGIARKTGNRAVNGAGGNRWPLPNVLLGTSVEDDTRAADRLPRLWDIKRAGWTTFVSYEPALGSVRWGRHAVFGAPPAPDSPTPKSTAFDWLIVGGESGHGARPFNVEWAREAVAFCRKAGVPVFVKQLGSKPVASYYDAFREEWEFWGFDWPDPLDWRLRDGQPPIGSLVGLPLQDKKGGNPLEWPAELRIREMPTTTGLTG